MDYSIIIRPLIGAGIGYVTNWIAVKMLFRPLHPIKIGKISFPFTPGIIPKNKNKLAESIGNTISTNLLTDSDLKEVLLSEEIKHKIKISINEFLNKSENHSIEEFVCLYLEKDSYKNILHNLEVQLSNSIYNTVIEANLASIISEQIELAAKEKLKGSMLGLLGGNAIVASFVPTINSQLENYIKTNGQSLIQDTVSTKLNNFTTQTTIRELSNISSSKFNLSIEDIIFNIYEKIIDNKISEFLETINVSKIVTQKINDMEVLELEKLILIIMKKELNALVNLGAIIGFVLGLLNLLF